MKKYILLCLLFVLLVSPYCEKIVTINVLPDQKTLKPGESCRFVAQGYNGRYEEVSFSPEWATSGGGSITSDGLFHAGSNPGIYFVRAIHRASGAEGSAVVTIKGRTQSTTSVTSQRIVRIELQPADITIMPGQRVNFTINVYNEKNQNIPLSFAPRWRTSGGSISPDGTYQAGGAPGDYLISVSDPDSRWNAHATVHIGGQSYYVSHVRIYPSTATLKPYKDIRFFATAYNTAGATVTTNYYWECTGGGTIDRNGIFKASNTPGTYTVRVRTQEGVSSVATVTVEPFQLSRLEIISPQTTFIPGQIAQFVANAYDESGNITKADVYWSAGGGIMKSDGTFQAGNFPGNYVIRASAGKLSTSTRIEIRANENRAVRLVIEPQTASLIPGQRMQFYAQAYNKQGQLMNIPPVQWIARGGSIDSDGVYQAGNVPGKYIIEARAIRNLSANIVVSIEQPMEEPVEYYAPEVPNVSTGIPAPIPGQTQISQPAPVIQEIPQNMVSHPMPPTPPNSIEPNPIYIIVWKTGQGDMSYGRIEIKGRLFTDNASRLELVLENIYGQEETLSRVAIQAHGAQFQFNGQYLRQTTRAIKVVLYDKQNIKTYEVRKETR